MGRRGRMCYTHRPRAIYLPILYGSSLALELSIDVVLGVRRDLYKSIMEIICVSYHILPDVALINGQSVFNFYTSHLDIANVGAAV
jgi:hypothetical protein